MTLMNRLEELACLAAAWLLLAMSVPAAAQSTFRISQVFSNLDGSVQFVVLTEMAGLDGQDRFKGLTLTVTRDGVVKQFTFYDNLATPRTAHLSIVVAATVGGSIVDVTGNDILSSHPDFIVPARFLPTRGGTVDLAGIDSVTYPALPTDGSTAWYRDGTLAPGAVPGRYGCNLTPSSGCAGTITPTPTRVAVVEYHDASRDHYFMTAAADEIDALDSGRTPGWQRTGEALYLGATARTPQDLEYVYYASPVCRFYLPPSAGDSHFFSASADECAAVRARFPSFVEETSAAFYAARPDAGTGSCGVIPGFVDGDEPMLPIYRLWNQRADTNHRYTWKADIRDAMIARGWLSEGYGALGVAMCF